MRKIFLLLFFSVTAWAHKPSDSYLTLVSVDDRITGEWHLSIRDLETVVPMDLDGSLEITWGEVKEALPRIKEILKADLKISASNECPIEFKNPQVTQKGDGGYLVFPISARCNGSTWPFKVHYEFLFEQDSQHRGLVTVNREKQSVSHVFSFSDREVVFDDKSATQEVFKFISLGMKHIWMGFDHILFLLVLLLPSVLHRRRDHWEPEESLQRVCIQMAKIVTAFTVSHSITLGCAAMGWVHIPSRIVESAIALSVLLAALNNVWPVVTERQWGVAFVFGLLHGFGFAGVLEELISGSQSIVPLLLGFNVGVEIGQMVVVAVLLPMIFWARHTRFYLVWCLRGGSLGASFIALLWVIDRVGDLGFMPF